MKKFTSLDDLFLGRQFLGERGLPIPCLSFTNPPCPLSIEARRVDNEPFANRGRKESFMAAINI
jgi:hypothetical protein